MICDETWLKLLGGSSEDWRKFPPKRCLDKTMPSEASTCQNAEMRNSPKCNTAVARAARDRSCTWLMATLTEVCRKSPVAGRRKHRPPTDDISAPACLWEDATAEPASFLLPTGSPSSPASATNEVSTSESKCARDQKLLPGRSSRLVMCKIVLSDAGYYLFQAYLFGYRDSWSRWS